MSSGSHSICLVPTKMCYFSINCQDQLLQRLVEPLSHKYVHLSQEVMPCKGLALFVIPATCKTGKCVLLCHPYSPSHQGASISFITKGYLQYQLMTFKNTLIALIFTVLFYIFLRHAIYNSPINSNQF